MKGKKSIMRVLAIIMIGGGFLSVMEVVAGELPRAPSLKVAKIYLGFHGDEKAEALGELAYYTVNPENGCVQDFYDKGGRIPKTPEPPDWLVKVLYSASFDDLQCRQAVIGIVGSPIEYYSKDGNGNPICIGAWDPDCPKWTPRCKKPYTCP